MRALSDSTTVELYGTELRAAFTVQSRYVATVGPSKPAINIPGMPLDTEYCLDLLHKLRYARSPDGSDPEARQALRELASKVAEIFKELPLELISRREPYQVDLVLNADELGVLPFEACLGADGRPLFAGRTPAVVLTRRIRQAFQDRQSRWPIRPRVLFVAAEPHADLAPELIEEHHKALREALHMWLPGSKSEDPIYQFVSNPTAGDIAHLFKTARKNKKPITHLHILAHGERLENQGSEGRAPWGLRLGDPSPLEPKHLAEAIAPDGLPAVVTIAGCDTANQMRVFSPTENFAHALHRKGVPVVVASQLPLLKTGSVTLCRAFYKELFDGADVRLALAEARARLLEGAGHDWISVVAYVQLPEGYEDLRIQIALRVDLAHLKEAKQAADALDEDSPLGAFEEIESTLRSRIKALETRQKELRERELSDAVYQENQGLLGSAHKRLAHLTFERSKRENGPELRARSVEDLKNALLHYGKAYEKNLSHHWSGIQQLSLEAVLHGKLSKDVYWNCVMEMARRDLDQRQGDWWRAYGTLAEVYLLAGIAGQGDQLDKAQTMLNRLKKAVKDDGADPFAISTTRDQIDRYVTWWTKENGFFADCNEDLAAGAGRLVAVVDDR